MSTWIRLRHLRAPQPNLNPVVGLAAQGMKDALLDVQVLLTLGKTACFEDLVELVGIAAHPHVDTA